MKRDDVKSREWLEEYNAFLKVDDARVPDHLSQSVLNFVHRELNPSFWLVVSKLAALQAVIGGFSLMICSQFGVGTGQLVHVFMRFGDTMCMALCGALFLGFGAIMAGLFMKTAEVKLIRQTGYSPILLMGVLALGIFLGLGAEIVLGLGFVWLLGGFIAGMLALEVSARFRLRTANA